MLPVVYGYARDHRSSFKHSASSSLPTSLNSMFQHFNTDEYLCGLEGSSRTSIRLICLTGLEGNNLELTNHKPSFGVKAFLAPRFSRSQERDCQNTTSAMLCLQPFAEYTRMSGRP